jgi:hypothetical protein
VLDDLVCKKVTNEGLGLAFGARKLPWVPRPRPRVQAFEIPVDFGWLRVWRWIFMG